MKLYFFPVAPNPTRVRLYIAEKAQAGHDFGIEEVSVNLGAGEQNAPAFVAVNPFGRLPALELDDGSPLIESLVIIEYLEELAPEPTLIGIGPLDRARVRELERIAEMGALIPLARYVHATNSPLGLPRQPVIAEGSREVFEKGLGVLDDRLRDGRPFLAGDTVTIADCTLAAGLQFARFGKVELPEGLPHVTSWDRRFRARPAAKQVLVT